MDIEEIREGLLLPGKSRVGLAAALGIDVSQISRLLNGKRSLKVHEVESIRAYLYGAVKSGCGETPSDPFAKLKVVRELLDEAELAGLEPVSIIVNSLRDAIARRKSETWRAESQEKLDEYNRSVSSAFKDDAA